MASQHLINSTTENHARGDPSTNQNKVGGKEEKNIIKFLCELCMGEHLTHNSPNIVKTLLLLDGIFVSQKKPLVSSQGSFPTQPLVDEVVDLMKSSIDPTLPLESDSTPIFFHMVLITKYMNLLINYTFVLEK